MRTITCKPPKRAMQFLLLLSTDIKILAAELEMNDIFLINTIQI